MAATTTAQDIFDKAIMLMGEQSDTGLTDWADTAEYKLRVLGILNVLRGECYKYSDTYAPTTHGKRPVCTVITALTDIVGIDDVIAQTVMPYGLAAHLMLDEDTTAAGFFQQRYEELLARLGGSIPADWGGITDVYGVGEDYTYGQFGRW